MKRYEREITEAKYNEIKTTRVIHFREFFTEAQIMGYGIYGTAVEARDGKYYLTYYQGSTCD